MSYRNSHRDRDRDYDTRYRENDRDSSRRGGGGSGHERGYDISHDDRDKYAGEYVSICLKNLNDNLSDSQLRDAIYHEFKRFGEFNIKIVTNKNARNSRSDRIAFINFNSHSEAREAKRCKMNMPFEGYPLYIEPVFVNRPGARDTNKSYRPMSKSRNYSRSRSRSRSYSRSRHHRPSTPPPTNSTINGRSSRRQRSRSLYSNNTSKRASSIDSLDNYNRNINNKRNLSTSPPMQYTSNYLKTTNNNKQRSSSSVSSSKDDNDLYDSEATRTLFVGNLEMGIDKDDLREKLDRYGYIEDIDIKRVSNKQYSYAFVKYVNLDMASKAKKEMDGKRLGRTHIRIGFAKVLPTECLWIGGLNTRARKKDIEKEFGKYGSIGDIDWTPGDQYAYVLFESVRDADTARANMKGKILMGDASSRLRLDFVDPERFESYREKIKARRNRSSRSPSITKNKTPSSRSRSVSPIKKHQETNKRTNNDDYREVENKKPKRREQTPESRDVSPICKNGSSIDRLIQDSLINRELKKLSISDFNDINKTLKCYWNGVFTLKKIAFPTKFYLLAGNKHLVEKYLPKSTHNSQQSALKITQRLRLDPSKIEELEKKLQDLHYDDRPSSRASSISSNSTLNDSNPSKPSPNDAQFCVLLSLPDENESKKQDENGKEDTQNESSVSLQQRSLHNLITYLNQKTAAGCIPLPDDDNPTAMVHAFPPQSTFSTKLVKQLLPSIKNLTSEADTKDYLIIVLLKN